MADASSLESRGIGFVGWLPSGGEDEEDSSPFFITTPPALSVRVLLHCHMAAEELQYMVHIRP